MNFIEVLLILVGGLSVMFAIAAIITAFAESIINRRGRR